MVATAPKGVYTMKNRYVTVKHNAKAYQRTTKRQKAQMLDELSQHIEYLTEEPFAAYERKLRRRRKYHA